MSNEKYNNALSLHPVLAKLASAQDGKTDQSGTGVVALSGYVGAADTPNRLRLYGSLANLEFWIEINHSDIVHAAITNQEYQRVTVWLQRDAIAAHVMYRNLQARELQTGDLQYPFTPSSAIVSGEPFASMSASDMISISKGRLRMLLKNRGSDAMDALCCAVHFECGTPGPTGPTSPQ